MIREAFGTRKRFLGVPKVSFAGWVGTIMHSTMAEGEGRAEQRHWFSGWRGTIVKVKKYGAQKTKTHTSCTLELLTLQ